MGSMRKIYKVDSNMERNDDPFFRYTKEERINMSQKEYCALIEARNEYVRKKHSQINEQAMPHFNTIEELRAYYDCIPFDDFAKSIGCLEEYNQRINNAMAVCSQSQKKFHGPEDLTDENFEKGWRVIEELSQRAEKSSKILCESSKPRFNTEK